jgi:hypothetical protein
MVWVAICSYATTGEIDLSPSPLDALGTAEPTKRTALCCIARNEARDIGEWIIYHARIGFDAIILYNHRSVDSTGEVATRAAALAEVDLTVVPWDEEISPQNKAYSHALDTFGEYFEWMAFIDSDEFIVPVKDRTIGQFLDSLGPVSAVAIHWVCYGSSGYVAFPAGSVTASFLWRGPLGLSINCHVKMIVRPKKVDRVINPHYFSLKEGSECYTPMLELPSWRKPGKTLSPSGQDIIRINHYFTRSRAHFLEKLARPRATKAHVVRVDNFAENDTNDELDPVIPYLFPNVLTEIKSNLALIRPAASEISISGGESV